MQRTSTPSLMAATRTICGVRWKGSRRVCRCAIRLEILIRLKIKDLVGVHSPKGSIQSSSQATCWKTDDMSSTDAMIGSEDMWPSAEAASHHRNDELVKLLHQISHEANGHTAHTSVERTLQQRRLLCHRSSRHRRTREHPPKSLEAHCTRLELMRN